jgi:hypothetical protein
VVAFGNTARARKLPKASCCQFRKCSAGVILSEYEGVGVRECGAGRRRMTCGESVTARS